MACYTKQGTIFFLQRVFDTHCLKQIHHVRLKSWTVSRSEASLISEPLHFSTKPTVFNISPQAPTTTNEKACIKTPITLNLLKQVVHVVLHEEMYLSLNHILI